VPRLTPVSYQKLVKVFEKDGFTFITASMKAKGFHHPEGNTTLYLPPPCEKP